MAQLEARGCNCRRDSIFGMASAHKFAEAACAHSAIPQYHIRRTQDNQGLVKTREIAQ